ncbi:MAG: SIMPL domain-containing protein [Muribaculaceae bacterium]|nr:SIMPL domain-containing protein [Muribaculaceae bacterium]
MYDRLRGNVTIFGIFVCAGLIVLGIFIRYGLTHLNDSHRIVTVRGLCEREVNANKVTWPIVSKEVGNYLPSIFQNVENTNTMILKFLKENGIEESEISVNPPAVVDLQADRYSYNQSPYRYNVTNVVVVTSSKVEKVNELIKKQAELLKQGIAIVAGDYQYQTIYEYTDLNSIKPEMIEEATINARAAADKFAEDSGSKVGKIQTASQGQFSIEDRDQYTPYIKKIRVVSSINYYIND